MSLDQSSKPVLCYIECVGNVFDFIRCTSCAMTISIMTISINGLFVTLSIMVLSMVTLCIKGLFVILSINEIKHNNNTLPLC
jgi:hypothetical protein